MLLSIWRVKLLFVFAVFKLRIANIYLCALIDRVNNKRVTADNNITTDNRISAEYTGIRVNGHIIADRRMTLDSLELLSFSCGKTAEGNSLIYLYIVADNSCFTDYNARSVVNKEVFSRIRK